MANDDGFLQGDNEPAASRVILVGALVSALIFMVVFSILYPGQNYPVISDFETFGALTGGIWFFILGAMFGIFAILATMITEATRE
ncbi:MAG: hypothetical protein CMA06_04760 [Euryarchaeota archaeon]|jgi:hypothetical protein|nr:hypothetical protein [Euryarchaeota archaeon]MDC0040589.1 hypothetical protein [Candidatus Poseidoniales archaeon]MDP6885659.1 hypothetical protein [Candidatus Thalassarchaeaceae archaeon]MAU18129.1 hypothetical protein [Euryarchaeota archaeon]MDC0149978.1 hypothetical protein [Candidatus Poseidoniales archaeon]|tara:strand:- start:12783 stop:13040 length:258 start_codon:yes stop_codon:yes gene_type:complete